MQFILLRYP